MKEIGIDNVAPTGLSCGMYAPSVSCATLAYGYAHFTPAALGGQRYVLCESSVIYGYTYLASVVFSRKIAKSRRDNKCITVGCAIAAPTGNSVSHPSKSRRDDRCITVCKRSVACGGSMHPPAKSRRDDIIVQ